MVATASQYGCPQRSCMVSHIASGFPHHVIMHPQLTTMFLVSIIAVSCRLPVCCNRESTGWALELLVIMVYTDDLEGGVSHPIHELSIENPSNFF